MPHDVLSKKAVDNVILRQKIFSLKTVELHVC